MATCDLHLYSIDIHNQLIYFKIFLRLFEIQFSILLFSEIEINAIYHENENSIKSNILCVGVNEQIYTQKFSN